MGIRLGFIALLLSFIGLVLAILALRARRARGLGGGKTVALDNFTLFSKRLRLVGRPDRLIKQGNLVIPDEWKSSKRVSEGHRLQLGTYFLLIEEEFGVRPPHGFIVLGDRRSREDPRASAETRRRDSCEPISGQVPGVRPTVNLPSISGVKSVSR